MRVRCWCLGAGVLRKEIMGWLSINSPTIERLIGGRSRSSGKVKQSRGRGRRGARSAETPLPEIDVSVLKSAFEPDPGLEPETDSAVGVAIAEDGPIATAMEAATQALTGETTATPAASRIRYQQVQPWRDPRQPTRNQPAQIQRKKAGSWTPGKRRQVDKPLLPSPQPTI